MRRIIGGGPRTPRLRSVRRRRVRVTHRPGGSASARPARCSGSLRAHTHAMCTLSAHAPAAARRQWQRAREKETAMCLSVSIRQQHQIHNRKSWQSILSSKLAKCIDEGQKRCRTNIFLFVGFLSKLSCGQQAVTWWLKRRESAEAAESSLNALSSAWRAAQQRRQQTEAGHSWLRSWIPF